MVKIEKICENISEATVMASIVSTSACFWSHYQPEEPKSLREE